MSGRFLKLLKKGIALAKLSKILSFLPFQRFKNPPALVAVIAMLGTIAPKGRFGQSLNLAALEDSIEQAFTLSGVKAVALSINSPGGSPVQSALIMRRVRALAAEKKLPVYVFAEDVAASGGYLIALAGDEIYAHEASLVGSIGVIFSGFGFPEVMKKIGVERRVYTAGEKKSMLDPFRPEDEKDISHIKELQKDIHLYFQSLVTERRGDKLKGDKAELFSGDIWTGSQALSLGLIDGVGDMRSVMREKFGKKTKFKVMGREKSWLSSKLGLGARRSGIGAEVLDALEARSLWAHFGL
jgi:signal peptide peptidase SppA